MTASTLPRPLTTVAGRPDWWACPTPDGRVIEVTRNEVDRLTDAAAAAGLATVAAHWQRIGEAIDTHQGRP